jgi:hypothetical protein
MKLRSSRPGSVTPELRPRPTSTPTPCSVEIGQPQRLYGNESMQLGPPTSGLLAGAVLTLPLAVVAPC